MPTYQKALAAGLDAAIAAICAEADRLARRELKGR